MEWNGKCGEQCQWYRFIKKWRAWIEGRCKFSNITHCVEEGHHCFVLPTGPWNFDMSKAPKDGTAIFVLTRYMEVDVVMWNVSDVDSDIPEGVWVISTKESKMFYDEDVPIAFALINKPWE